MEWQDAAITSYITTKGSRERKINPGVLYIAVRQGLEDSDHYTDDEDHMNTVSRFLCALGLLLPDASRRSHLE